MVKATIFITKTGFGVLKKMGEENGVFPSIIH